MGQSERGIHESDARDESHDGENEGLYGYVPYRVEGNISPVVGSEIRGINSPVSSSFREISMRTYLFSALLALFVGLVLQGCSEEPPDRKSTRLNSSHR